MTTGETDGVYWWVTKSGAVESGSEGELFAAVHRGEVRDVDYDASTGLYRWRERKR